MVYQIVSLYIFFIALVQIMRPTYWPFLIIIFAFFYFGYNFPRWAEFPINNHEGLGLSHSTVIPHATITYNLPIWLAGTVVSMGYFLESAKNNFIFLVSSSFFFGGFIFVCYEALFGEGATIWGFSSSFRKRIFKKNLVTRKKFSLFLGALGSIMLLF